MRKLSYTLIFILIGLSCCSGQMSADSIVKIEMNLSAFGVESDDFPSIDVMIDFSRDTSVCVKSFYNPAYEGSAYSLNKNEMQSILELLKISDLEKLEKEYIIDKTDQPRSVTKIYTANKVFIIDDYGLEGEYPLQDLYKIVYKF